MFCPTDANTGLIHLVGPISSSDLSDRMITVNKSALSFSFGVRTTTPTLVGNRIDESSSNHTCKHNHINYNLADIQITSPVHTGFNLPGDLREPQAELILSFAPSTSRSSTETTSSTENLTGLLVCFPIFVSSSSVHADYLEQVIKNDPSNTVIPTLETLFYSSKDDTSQTSFRYITCFETATESNYIQSHSLYVHVYPNGVQLSSASYQQLYSLLHQQLTTYQLPPGLRDFESTVRDYKMTDDGRKLPTQIDSNGVIYRTPLSTCSTEFKSRLEYFTKPPKIQGSKSPSSTSSSSSSSKTCPTLQQYKCVPFDQLRDVNGGYVKVSDGTCLDDVIKSGKSISDGSEDTATPDTSTSKSMSMEEIEEMVGGIAAGIVLIGGIIWIGSKLSNSND